MHQSANIVGTPTEKQSSLFHLSLERDAAFVAKPVLCMRSIVPLTQVDMGHI